MATFGDVLLIGPGQIPTASGAVFRLAGVAPVDAVERFPNGASIEIRSGTSYIAARTGNATSHADALAEALSVAQQGLDLLSIQGKADLSTRDVEHWHITWWADGADTILRFTEVSLFGMSWTVNVQVMDSEGNIKPDPPAPPIKWDESFRYHRLAQVTDDLFDAYRNLYLALESLLSSIEPMRTNPSTGRFEGEREWFLRALSKTGVGGMERFAPEGTKSPARDIFADIYVDMRTSLFHAKGDRPHFRPHEHDHRARVQASFARLTELYLAIVESRLGVRRPTGGTTIWGFQMMTSSLDVGSEILVSSERFAEADVPRAVASGRFHALHTRRATELDRDFFKSFLGTLDVRSLSAPPAVQEVVLLGPGKEPILLSELDQPLVLAHVARFEAHLPLRERHPQMPREIYTT